MQDIIDNAGGIWPAILLIMVCVNMGLGALQKILEKVKDITATETDNKIYGYVSTAVAWISKFLDWVGANRVHK